MINLFKLDLVCIAINEGRIRTCDSENFDNAIKQ